MKTTFRIAAVALSFAAAGAAFASGEEYVDATLNAPQGAALTRAEVQATLKQAIAEGSIIAKHAAADGSTSGLTQLVAQRSRADVRAEVQADRGTHFALSSEVNSL